jgi:dUTP pyrophosphatase
MDPQTNEKCIKVVLDDEKAVFPKKAHQSDIGYDLTAIGFFKKVSKSIIMFETGIRVSPPSGYYLEILPRSSLSKTGYMLANSVGIIDPDYSGTLKIALIKVDNSLPDLELPFTRCQLVLRKAERSEMILVDTLDHTVRGGGGFGSTDKINK